MKTIRTLSIVQTTTGPISLRGLATSGGFTAPVSITQLLQRLSVKSFDAIVTTPDPEALGGDVHLTIRGDGTYELKVHMHDSGAPDYSVRLGIFLRSMSGRVFVLYSRGAVRGSDYAILHPTATGFREFDDSQQGSSDALRDDWDDFSAGSLQVNREWTNNLEQWAASFFLEKFIFIMGAVTIGGPATLVMWGAGELADLVDFRVPGELGLTGLVAAEGFYFLAGPTYFVPVFIGGAMVSAALFKRRRLHSEERDELYKVFADTLDYNRIWITNLEGLDGRPFTLFNPSEEIVLAASPSVFPDFDNLLADDGTLLADGVTKRVNLTKRVFVHEITHAWQYQHRRFLTNLCNIIATRGEEVLYGQGTVYRYTPGSDWDSYNMEQQADIVADWYSVQFNGFVAGRSATSTSNTDNYRYIRDNILMG